MTEKRIHIVSFDIPYPANYGGVIDVFYKLKSLHKLGWKIHLHCFVYGRQPSAMLNSFCERVSYYHRDISKSKLFLKIPYIVCSRNNKLLIEALLEDNDPIIFEGLHTTYGLLDDRLQGRKVIVRAHNIEHEYYRNLGLSENNLFKRYYFNNEATKLETYEPILNLTSGIASISRADQEYFNKKYGDKSFYVSAFHPYDKLSIPDGLGKYILYHANLSVSENHKAVMYLIKNVFNSLKMPVKIAGYHPKSELRLAIKGNSTIELIENPSNEKMDQLIKEAQIHVLPSFQSTGIKLKLLAALFSGRHVITNSTMIAGTGLDTLCEIADDPIIIKEMIEKLFDAPLSLIEKNKRAAFLNEEFSNLENAKKIEKFLLDF